jgi:hypothetical protein
MIPADVVSRIQVAADTSTRPVAAPQEISDKLSGLVPGQRLMAEIQALMPNGTYRAMINQRDVTLALPFSAKAGDALELEVVTTDGKLTLAVISRPDGDAGKNPPESVPTTLSRTGQLISNLLGNANGTKSGPAPTPLNGNQPIASAPPASAQDLLPLLKQAITQSGMFYESHQAEWVDGRLDKSALLQEPQGKLPAHAALVANRTGEAAVATRLATDSAPLQNTVTTDTAASRTASTTAAATTAQPSQLVASPLLPLVQQQLESLATQNFVWQGQVWPGQEMRWEIEEDGTRSQTDDNETAAKWQTRLRLTLPQLGEVDAQIRLQGTQISLALTANNTETQALLRTSTEALRSQLGEAGLALAAVGIGAAQESAADGQTEQ